MNLQFNKSPDSATVDAYYSLLIVVRRYWYSLSFWHPPVVEYNLNVQIVRCWRVSNFRYKVKIPRDRFEFPNIPVSANLQSSNSEIIFVQKVPSKTSYATRLINWDKEFNFNFTFSRSRCHIIIRSRSGSVMISYNESNDCTNEQMTFNTE